MTAVFQPRQALEIASKIVPKEFEELHSALAAEKAKVAELEELTTTTLDRYLTNAQKKIVAERDNLRTRCAELEAIKATLHETCAGYEARLADLQREKAKNKELLSAIKHHGIRSDHKAEHCSQVISQLVERLAREKARSAELREALHWAHNAMQSWFSSEYLEHPETRKVGRILYPDLHPEPERNE